MTQTPYRHLKMGTRRGKPVGWLAFCFSLSPRSSEDLGQFLPFGAGSLLCSLLSQFYLLTLDQHRGSSCFWHPSLSLHPSTLKGARRSCFLWFLFHMHIGIMSCSPLQRVCTWFLVFWQICCFHPLQVLKLPLHKLCIAQTRMPSCSNNKPSHLKIITPNISSRSSPSQDVNISSSSILENSVHQLILSGSSLFCSVYSSIKAGFLVSFFVSACSLNPSFSPESITWKKILDDIFLNFANIP